MTDFLLWLYYTIGRINKTINNLCFCAQCKKNILFFCLSLTQPSDSPHSPASHAFPACGEGAPVLTPGRMRSPHRPPAVRSLPCRSLSSHAFPACGEGAPVLTSGRMRSRARTRANYYIEETFLAALPSFRSWEESKEGFI